jgi:hypothetical protein
MLYQLLLYLAISKIALLSDVFSIFILSNYSIYKFINTACVTIVKTKQGECAISLYDFTFHKLNRRYMWC